MTHFQKQTQTEVDKKGARRSSRCKVEISGYQRTPEAGGWLEGAEWVNQWIGNYVRNWVGWPYLGLSRWVAMELIERVSEQITMWGTERGDCKELSGWLRNWVGNRIWNWVGGCLRNWVDEWPCKELSERVGNCVRTEIVGDRKELSEWPCLERSWWMTGWVPVRGWWVYSTARILNPRSATLSSQCITLHDKNNSFQISKKLYF
jgi:hypothetical protein